MGGCRVKTNAVSNLFVGMMVLLGILSGAVIHKITTKDAFVDELRNRLSALEVVIDDIESKAVMDGRELELDDLDKVRDKAQELKQTVP